MVLDALSKCKARKYLPVPPPSFLKQLLFCCADLLFVFDFAGKEADVAGRFPSPFLRSKSRPGLCAKHNRAASCIRLPLFGAQRFHRVPFGRHAGRDMPAQHGQHRADGHQQHRVDELKIGYIFQFRHIVKDLVDGEV